MKPVEKKASQDPTTTEASLGPKSPRSPRADEAFRWHEVARRFEFGAYDGIEGGRSLIEGYGLKPGPAVTALLVCNRKRAEVPEQRYSRLDDEVAAALDEIAQIFGAAGDSR